MHTLAASRPNISPRRTWIVPLVGAVAVGLLLAAPALAAPDGRAHPKHEHRAPHRHGPGHGGERGDRPPTIRWSPGGVKETVARGGSKTALVSFSSTRDLTDVAVAVGRELAPYVTASPSFFSSIEAGTTTTVTLTFSAPVEAKVGALDGALRLRASGTSKRTYARPLPLRVRFTRGHPPVADAGPDQTSGVLVGDAVLLDGSASSDPDGQALTFAWSLLAVPADSTASLSDPAAARPAFVADRPGTYTARLTVNDGVVDSTPDDISVTVVVPPPAVSIVTPENLSVVTASPVTVTGTVDDPTAIVTVNGVPVANDNGDYGAAVALVEGSNIVTVIGQNGTGQGSASVEVILNTTDHPVMTITSPTRSFIAGEAFAMGEAFHAAQVAVAGVIKVNTRAPLPIPNLNQPTVTVNGVQADVSLNLFYSGCGLLNPFQCWRFTATVPLDQGDRTITAVGTDVAGRSTAASIRGTVDYCRIGEYDSQASTPGKDPGVVALAGLNHDIQSNRCHEIDGCSAPLVSQECADDPMSCPNPFLGVVPALVNVAPTAFGKGANPPEEHFVHGRYSAFDLPCNRHDVCYQTCVRVTGLSDADREQAWTHAWHTCNLRQNLEMFDVCSRAYPATCPFTILGIPDPVKCVRWLQEKIACSQLARAYFLGVETGAGFERFKERQMDYCAD